ncbi:MAG TPA: GntR family transcriptional regulator [Candidatus Saccharimonadales bacterium]|nr:GntR family transcriptional regulator [Candidatus Saccharimonadales bacterium]
MSDRPAADSADVGAIAVASSSAPVPDAGQATDAPAAPPLFQPHDVPSLRDRAYDDIREAILIGALRPGDRIKERDVAAQMGVSTTPVKEALRRLEQEGLVVSQPRRGAVVGPLILTPAEEILQLRADLEGMAARLAATKMTPEEKTRLREQVEALEALDVTGQGEAVVEGTAVYHHAIRDGARNEFLSRFLGVLAPFDRTIRRISTLDPREAHRDTEEHREIMEAIAADDGETAERVMHEHIHRVIRFAARTDGGTSEG